MKELAIVTVNKIYVLVHPYQTLIREIATPTMPGFVTACLQLIKQKLATTPLTVVETICEAFSTLIPLYPTVFRPFSSQIRAATKLYIAPTPSDDAAIPESLTRAARKLAASIHFVAAKTGGSDEWAKLVDTVLRQLHATADQIFRAVDESWLPTSGYDRTKATLDGEPRGGGDEADQFPSWSGITSGADRLNGLLAFLSVLVQCPTKAPVAIPMGAIMDAVARVCVIARLSPKTQTWDQAIDTTPGIGRDEKDELWSVMPEIHVAALQLMLNLLQALGRDMIPLVADILDHLIRTFKSGMSNAPVRAIGYKVLNAISAIAGPTMPKTMTDMLEPIAAACCRDLQEDAGYLKPNEKPSAAGSKDGKKNSVAANADLFLQTATSTPEVIPRLEPYHREAASQLLIALLSSFPQANFKPTIRGILDKTAILTRSRDAMFASVLNPFKDQRGHMYPSILPYLSQQYPQDQGLEILRSNLRTSALSGTGDLSATFNTIAEEEEEEEEGDQDEQMTEETQQEPANAEQEIKAIEEVSNADVVPSADVELPIVSNPFEANADNVVATNAFAVAVDAPTKRKNEEVEPATAKRQELEKPKAAVITQTGVVIPTVAVDDEDDDSDASVHLNMELDDDDEDDE